ncbi:MAG TPA: histidine kinase [Propionibacteriaceae bacterium]|nr:histidine kinase [Propionibacteriaceae bacterium]
MLFDLLIGVAAAAVALIRHLNSPLDQLDPRLVAPTVLSGVLTAVAGLALVVRRIRPILSFAVIAGAAAIISLTNHYVALLPVVLLVSLYSVASVASRRAGIAALIVSISAFGGLALIGVPDLRLLDVGQSSALLVAAWAIGYAVRSRRQQESERLRAAQQDARAAREEAGRAAAEERLRIARELHDVVAHSMSMIAVQAGVGAHVIKTDPQAAERALEVIAQTSRDALVQTRSMLGMLREEQDQPPQLAMPRLENVADLVDRVRESGLDVTLTNGDLAALDQATSLAGYRVVQESLTNVIKHAEADRAEVSIRTEQDQLVIMVTDDGRGRPGSPGGHGLAGLQERARLLGGQFSAGPDPKGGFRVRAQFPLAARSISP